MRRLLKVTLKITVLRYFTLCILVKISQHLRGTCCLRLQVGCTDEGSMFLETFVKLQQPIWPDITEDSEIHRS
jgi:hypothetical protein